MKRKKRPEGVTAASGLIILDTRVIITSPLIIKSTSRKIAEASISKICLHSLYDYDSNRTIKGLALKNFLQQLKLDGIEVSIHV